MIFNLRQNVIYGGLYQFAQLLRRQPFRLRVDRNIIGKRNTVDMRFIFWIDQLKLVLLKGCFAVESELGSYVKNIFYIRGIEENDFDGSAFVESSKL